MKHFEKFVQKLVTDWRTEKKTILENAGLAGLNNKEYGDKAENYIKGKIEKLTSNYTVILSPGSQSPSDIFSVARRSGYWHIMLIQVKSSYQKDLIYKLTEDDKKAFQEFARFLKKKLKLFNKFKIYWDKSIIISTGYAGVLRIENKVIQHRLIETKSYKLIRLNSTDLDMGKVKQTVNTTHEL